MDGNRFLRVKGVFQDALALPAAARPAYLSEACDGDGELRAEVEDLLRHAAAASGFLEQGAVAPEAPPGLGPLAIPGFRVLEPIASGASGVVWLAEQESPRRQVALKVLRIDSLGPGQVARFRREAEILARLSHPGIAQVHGAGVEDAAPLPLPWLALEYLRGHTLDEHVRRRRPDTRALLELFVAVCAAVEHANGKGIVHRDLKPSNVMVDEHGRPKVLDFGVARLLEGDELVTAERTRTGALIGTLSYMAPEQARGDHAAVDARADVYALGAMLFELLAGRLPLELDGLDLLQAVQFLCEVEPARLRQLRPELPADLDAILAKALEKEPRRRYASAGELGADLDRLLADRPVVARRPSTLHQARKFVHRNRALSVAALGVVAALGLGLALALASLRVAREQRARTSDTLDFMTVKLLEFTSRLGFGEEQRPDLEQLVARIRSQRRVDPQSTALRAGEAQVLFKLAELDQAQGDHASMRANLLEARALRSELAVQAPGDLASQTHLSQIFAKLGEVARAEGDLEQRDAWFARALEVDEQLVADNPDDRELIEDLGWSLGRLSQAASERDDHELALQLALQRMNDAQGLVDAEPQSWKYVYNLSHAHYFLAGMLELRGQLDQAVSHARRSLELARRFVDLQPGRRDALEWLVHVQRGARGHLLQAGYPHEARDCAEKALSLAEELLLGDPGRSDHVTLVIQAAWELAWLGDACGDPGASARAAARIRELIQRLETSAAAPCAPALLELADELAAR